MCPSPSSAWGFVSLRQCSKLKEVWGLCEACGVCRIHVWSLDLVSEGNSAKVLSVQRIWNASLSSFIYIYIYIFGSYCYTAMLCPKEENWTHAMSPLPCMVNPAFALQQPKAVDRWPFSICSFTRFRYCREFILPVLFELQVLCFHGSRTPAPKIPRAEALPRSQTALQSLWSAEVGPR
jgi:hypothetical protein